MAENIMIDKLIGESGPSNSNVTSQSQSVQSKVKRQRKKRSVAWEQFGQIIDLEGNQKGVCKHCKREYFVDSKENGTKSPHMANCTKMPLDVAKSQSKIAFKPIPGGNKGDVDIIPWKFDQEQCRKALYRMVIVDELPFSFVEKEGFMKYESCTTFFEFLHVELEWEMHKRIINFCPISSHRGEDMANSIINCLKEWGLQKIFTVTDDNASSNDVTVKELSKKLTKWGTNSMNGKYLHVRCMSHIMNLVVQDGIKESTVSIERIRQAVRYIGQSPARWKKFQECCDEGNLVRKSLCLDVPTRWNSTYLMLNRAIEYESAILEYADHNIGLSRHLEFVDIVDGSSCMYTFE
ncbi:zinc finger BED domain-containing protein RICESLEEPER 2-like [Nicotiana tabacum]|uniref:Zinc finger BED domain-containing protein RICESLEEPER 2-like n=1 Tax=Nicotiana tabacum TaxID=4097 RepID=A0AC58UHB3_TOBAC